MFNYLSYYYQEDEADFNISFASVFGVFGTLLWGVLFYFKLQQEYIWSRKRLFIQHRGRIAIGDFSIEAEEKFIEPVEKKIELVNLPTVIATN